MKKMGFGMLRLPWKNNELDYLKIEEIIEEYFKNDFRYFDIHPSYLEGNAEHIVRDYVVKKHKRDEFYLANKMPYYNLTMKSDYKRIYDQELAKCGVDYFDYYMLHCINSLTYQIHEKLEGFDFLKSCKSEKTKVGISFHGSPELLDEICKKYSWLDFIQLQINILDWDSPIIKSKENYEIACKYNKEIFVMEALKGGKLTQNADALSKYGITQKFIVETSLEFLKTLDCVKIILNGFGEKEHVVENAKIIRGEKLEEQIVHQNIKKIKNLMTEIDKYNCTKCGYCINECKQNIKIPEVIDLVNSCSNVGYRDRTSIGRYKKYYNELRQEERAANKCIQCGACEKICTQKIEIRKAMKEAKKMFENSGLNYTDELNVQILVSLLKQNGIKRVIASPGALNMSLVYTFQQDSYFDLISAPDERSAAYMACGLSEETGEVVVLSCTGATASRNYMPGLTEAFYRKQKILAIVSTREEMYIGNNVPQVLDQRQVPTDTCLMSKNIHIVKKIEDKWECEKIINEVLNTIETKNGPIIINLETDHNDSFERKNLLTARKINKYYKDDILPNLESDVAIFCGAHKKWSNELTNIVDLFCEENNALVICDHTSNYKGKYDAKGYNVLNRDNVSKKYSEFKLIIHIGNTSGSYIHLNAEKVWRVNDDGKYVDTFKALTDVFEMSEEYFFKFYVKNNNVVKLDKYKSWIQKNNNVMSKITELPFSNAYIASELASQIPSNAEVHFGILNSLRCWNYFNIPKEVCCYSNTGGFGIDGCVSTMIGASTANINKLFFGIFGDLAFFYDMNVLGNKSIQNNVRIIVVNNGGGIEFKNYNHAEAKFGDEANQYMAAMGHYGNKSDKLLKGIAQSLGFDYLSARNKKEFGEIKSTILEDNLPRSLIVEIFTKEEDESNALRAIRTIEDEPITGIESKNIIEKDDREIVLWGCGNFFKRNYQKVLEIKKINFVVDNDPTKWGKEIVLGIKCISFKELKAMKNIYIVLMVDNKNALISIAKQLMCAGIKDFDTFDNWIKNK